MRSYKNIAVYFLAVSFAIGGVLPAFGTVSKEDSTCHGSRMTVHGDVGHHSMPSKPEARSGTDSRDSTQEALDTHCQMDHMGLQNEAGAIPAFHAKLLFALDGFDATQSVGVLESMHARFLARNSSTELRIRASRIRHFSLLELSHYLI